MELRWAKRRLGAQLRVNSVLMASVESGVEVMTPGSDAGACRLRRANVY